MTNTEPPGGDTAVLAARLAPRWRLVRKEGAAGPLQFWRGVDTLTSRPVALTLLLPGDGLGRHQVDEIGVSQGRRRRGRSDLRHGGTGKGECEGGGEGGGEVLAT